MDQEQQIKEEPLGFCDDLFEFSDEQFRPYHLQDLFDVQEEVFIQEGSELIIQNLDTNHSSNGVTILETEVESMSSSTVNDEIPIPEGEEALCSVNRYDSNQEPNNKNSKNVNSHGNNKNKKNLLMAFKTYSKPHTCNPCGLSYTYKNVLLKHARLCHNHDGVKIVCTIKSNSDNYKDEELTILANSNKFIKFKYSCKICKARWNRFDIFKRHQRLHFHQQLAEYIEEETYRCIECEMLFKSLPELKLHIEQHLFDLSFPSKSKCLVYGGKFEDSDEMSDHDMSQLQIGSLTEYTCRDYSNLCKYDKLHQKDLIINNSSDDNVNKNDKGVTCGILNEEVAGNQVLIDHKASHVNTNCISQNSSTIKIFPCDSCDKVFKSKSSQKTHSRFHTGERPFNCKYCDKSFADKSTRRKHERIHTGKRPYVCAVCEKAFNQRVALRRHIQFTHAGYKTNSDNVEEYDVRIYCIICGFLCQSSSGFYLHLLQHSDENTAKSRAGTLKNQNFVPKEKDDTRTCSTVAYYSSISDSTVMNSSLADECKKNDSLIESDDEVSVKYNDLAHINMPEIVVQNKDKISNINSSKIKCKYQCLSKIGNQNNIWCSVSKAMTGQFDTDSCEDKPTLKSYINESMRCSSLSTPSGIELKSPIIISSEMSSMDEAELIESMSSKHKLKEKNLNKTLLETKLFTDLSSEEENYKIKQEWFKLTDFNDSYDVEPIITDEQSIQLIMIQDDMSYNAMSVDGPSESQAKPYKIVSKKFEKSEQHFSKQVSYGSKFSNQN